MRPIGEALYSLVPLAQWVVRDDVIEWLSNDIPRPSDEDITAERIRLQQIHDSKEYQRVRADKYPPIADQLDMLWHAMDSGVLPKYDPFYNALKAVKDQYPKV
jgi:hypothetical protein